jgi:transposase-like protein
MEFMREFPDDEACLEHLWRTRYSEDGEHAECPKCEQTRRFKRYETAKRRQSWTCTGCGHHIHPTAGTIFHKSSTSLHLWFYAIYLMASTRCGVSAKQLEREIGCNYKTALRMFHQIREYLMDQAGDQLTGSVEADETYIGPRRIKEGERRALSAQGIPNRGPATKNRDVVFAAVERKGRIRVSVIGTSQNQAGNAVAVRARVSEYVAPRSILYTDEYGAYVALARDYDHRTINHSQRVYVSGEAHTQTVDGFFALMKNAIRGVHHGVSRRWLQGYCNEYAFRWNYRDEENAMFRRLIASAASRV